MTDSCLVLQSYANMYTYTFFEKLERTLEKKPKQDIGKVIQSHAKSLGCAGYSCFTLSCFLCCCCTKCAGVFLREAEIGSTWKNNMNALYKHLTPSQRRVIFLRAMKTLSMIKTRMEQALQVKNDDTAKALALNQTVTYTNLKLDSYLLSQALSNGTWMNQVVSEVYMKLTSSNSALSAPLRLQDGLVLSVEEVNHILSALGMFYPITLHTSRYVSTYSFSPVEISIIQKQFFANQCLPPSPT